MAVYIDNARLGFGRMKMAHMLADTRAELDAMADRIGVARRWIQQPGTPDEHYDVCLAKRTLAIDAGAEPVDSRELVQIIRRKREAAAP